MQHIILVLSVTYTLQELHIFIPSIDLLCHYAKLFDKYSVSHHQCSSELYYWGRFFSLNSALEQLNIAA